MERVGFYLLPGALWETIHSWKARGPILPKSWNRPASVGDFLTAASITWNEIVKDLMSHGFWILVVMPPFFICYREAVGNLKGRAKEHKAWMEWYQQQGTTAAGDTFEESIPPENIRVNSYFRKAQKTLVFLIRNPKLLLIHFLCWIPAYFLLILLTEFPDLADVVRTAGDFIGNFLGIIVYLAILAAIFGLISQLPRNKRYRERDSQSTADLGGVVSPTTRSKSTRCPF